MRIHSEIRNIVFLPGIVMLILLAACTTPSIPEGTGTPTRPLPTATSRPAASLTPTPTLTPSPTTTPTPTPTPSPLPTPDLAALCRIPGEDGRIAVISDEKLQEHFMHYKAKEAFRETIRIYFPGWASYTQQLTFGKMVVTHDLATIIWNAGAECAERCPYPISVNPAVLMTVLILKYGEAPPPGFDAHQAVRQIALDIKRLYEEGRAHTEVWQGRFANLSSYVMYEAIGQDEDLLQQWCVVYHTFSFIWQTKRA